ncbi:MAG TPA: hypothetical protein VGD78_02255 [Chthoniobacterales bacterium]
MTALATGWSRTAIGTYDDAFITSGVLWLLENALVLSIARRPRLKAAFAALATLGSSEPPGTLPRRCPDVG